ncbi:hypothetical protein J5N97_008628 [Dioscorea zingiberensis]|uniref:Uncharacterized protein n=1 Tax=Dioscorea zingiberensis TaxID=325984 RepID=A0A9D5HL17_9LILI|nr:hypothetical protein J5N97_008628 [Dioscorea zingiberensis]
MEAIAAVPQEGEHPTPLQNLNNKVMELSKRIVEEKDKKIEMEKRLKELDSNYMVALTSNIKELQLHELEPYSFGSPAVDPVIQRYLSGNMEAVAAVPQERELPTPLPNLNNKVMELTKRIVEEKAKKVDMEKRLKELDGNYMASLSSNIKDLQLHELEALGKELNKLKDKANARIDEIQAASGSLDEPFLMNAFNMAGSSNQDLPMMPYPTVNVDTLPGNMGYGSFGP